MDNQDKKALIKLIRPTQVIVDVECSMPEKRHIGRIFDCHDLYFILIVDGGPTNDHIEADSKFELIKYDQVISITIRLD